MRLPAVAASTDAAIAGALAAGSLSVSAAAICRSAAGTTRWEVQRVVGWTAATRTLQNYQDSTLGSQYACLTVHTCRVAVYFAFNCTGVLQEIVKKLAFRSIGPSFRVATRLLSGILQQLPTQAEMLQCGRLAVERLWRLRWRSLRGEQGVPAAAAAAAVAVFR